MERKKIVNPSRETLIELAGGRKTRFDSISYITKVRSRSEKFTEVIFGQPSAEQTRLIKKVEKYLEDKELIILDRRIGSGTKFSFVCRLIITKPYARIAYMWGELLYNAPPSKKPDFVTIDVPEWPEIRVLVLPELGKTYILGIDYTGEAKMSFLRLAMYQTRLRGGLGLHAGSKLVRISNSFGPVERGLLFLGLSATGKTTLICHDFGLNKEDEEVILRQDDIVLIDEDGLCAGTEKNFYIKTEGLEPKNQPQLYKAATSPNAILENIFVDSGGNVVFDEYSLGTNGRCVVYRKEIENSDAEIDLSFAHIIFFITRRFDVVPPVAKLSKEQAVAFFMLGESIETSAGDPLRAGETRRVVGMNPFIIGDPAEEGNRFYQILQKNPAIECYLFNTGWVGGKDAGEDITIADTATIIREIVKGNVRWKREPFWGYQVAERIPSLDLRRFNLARFYSSGEIEEQNLKLLEERIEWLKKFPNLNKKITGVFQKLLKT